MNEIKKAFAIISGKQDGEHGQFAAVSRELGITKGAVTLMLKRGFAAAVAHRLAKHCRDKGQEVSMFKLIQEGEAIATAAKWEKLKNKVACNGYAEVAA